MDTGKKFSCNALSLLHTLDDAAAIAFGVAIGDGWKTFDDARNLFDELDLGETLVDEDGDTWERQE